MAVDRLVAKEHDRLRGGFARESAVLGAREDVVVGLRLLQHVVEAQQGGQHALDAAVDLLPRDVLALQRVTQAIGSHHAIRHLDVEPGGNRASGVADAEDPVADHEALEAPLVAQDVGEELSVVAAELAVHAL